MANIWQKWIPRLNLSYDLHLERQSEWNFGVSSKDLCYCINEEGQSESLPQGKRSDGRKEKRCECIVDKPSTVLGKGMLLRLISRL